MFEATSEIQLALYIVIGAGGGLLLILSGLVIHLLVAVHDLKKKHKKGDDDDNDSYDDESTTRQTVNNQPYNQHVYEESNSEPPYHVNPYNPQETYQIRRAKLIQSLRNKISPNSHSPSRHEEYSQPISDINSQLDDYPHPGHGTLKNEILNARSKMSKKPAAPKEWINPDERRRSQFEKPQTPSSEFAYPPKDYPGFPGNRNLQQPARKPYAQSVDNYPVRNSRGGLSRQEAEAMNEYDRTIANEERNFRPYPSNPGFLHNKYPK